MTSPAEIANDVAARIREADQYALDASAAFAAGRFQEWFEKQAQELKARLEAEGEKLLAPK